MNFNIALLLSYITFYELEQNCAIDCKLLSNMYTICFQTLRGVINLRLNGIYHTNME